MNVALSKSVQVNYYVPTMCKNCIHFVSKGNIFHDICSKFKTKTLFARSPQGKCGLYGSHFEFKGWLK
jgi:hypothetical protein